MFGSGILDAAIGLIFVYLLVSLMVTAATEFLSGILRWRSTHLREGIRTLLDSREASTWVDKLYSHPLVGNLRVPSGGKWIEKLYSLRGVRHMMPGRSVRGPSYIPSRTFAIALLESLREPQKGLHLAIDQIPDKASLEDLKKHLADWIDKLPAEDRWKALAAQWLANLPSSLSTADAKKWLHSISLQKVIQDISTSPDNNLKKSLLALYDEAHGDVEELKKSIEIWFNNSMDRVSGWYKRRTQTVHLLLASLIVVAINVDSVLIGNELFSNQTLRNALVAEAEVYARQGQQEQTPPQDQSAVTSVVKSAEQLKQLESRISKLGLPIGWACPVAATPKDELETRQQQHRISPWCRKIKASAFEALRFHLWGWLLSIFAVSLGAPFWFDMLNKVISIRSSGRAPEEKPKSPEKVPKPREPGNVPATPDAQRVVVEVRGTTPG